MKTRQGFVSNSSSSSYVVALRQDTPCKHCGRSDINFLDYLETVGRHDFESTQLHARGLERLRAYVEREITGESWRTDEEKKEWERIIQVAAEAVEKDYAVAYFEISSHDDVTNNMFRELEARNVMIPFWCDQKYINITNIKL